MRADEGSRFHSPPNRRGAVPFSQPAQSTALLHDAAPAAPDTSATDPQAAPSIAPTGPREVSSERPRRSVGDRSEGSTKAWGGASTGGGEGAVGAARPRRPRVRRLGGGREAAERSRGDREEIERRSPEEGTVGVEGPRHAERHVAPGPSHAGSGQCAPRGPNRMRRMRRLEAC